MAVRGGERRDDARSAGRRRPDSASPRGRPPWATAHSPSSRCRGKRSHASTADGTVSPLADLGGGPNGSALGSDGAVYVANNGGLSASGMELLARASRVRRHRPAHRRRRRGRDGQRRCLPGDAPHRPERPVLRPRRLAALHRQRQLGGHAQPQPGPRRPDRTRRHDLVDPRAARAPERHRLRPRRPALRRPVADAQDPRLRLERRRARASPRRSAGWRTACPTASASRPTDTSTSAAASATPSTCSIPDGELVESIETGEALAAHELLPLRGLAVRDPGDSRPSSSPTRSAWSPCRFTRAASPRPRQHDEARTHVRDPRSAAVERGQLVCRVREHAAADRARRSARVPQRLDGRAPLPRRVLVLVGSRRALRGDRRAHREHPHRARRPPAAVPLQPSRCGSAEAAATVDILSKGRLEFGTGRSGTRTEMEGFGIQPSETRPMWEEALEVIVGCWTEEEFSFEGEYFKLPPRGVVPKPMQQPHPPIWGATSSCRQPRDRRPEGTRPALVLGRDAAGGARQAVRPLPRRPRAGEAGREGDQRPDRDVRPGALRGHDRRRRIRRARPVRVVYPDVAEGGRHARRLARRHEPGELRVREEAA